MRVGVLGGTFDPPHNGHIAVAETCRNVLQLEEVILMPAARNPLKESASETPARHRMGMLKCLVEREPWLALSDMELSRGGASYTVDTLNELNMVQPAEYWFLMGADTLRGLPKWKTPYKLLRNCRLGVVIRPPWTEHDVAAWLPSDLQARVDLVPMAPIGTSSTEMRERLLNGQSVSAFMPESVLSYIQEHKLYTPK